MMLFRYGEQEGGSDKHESAGSDRIPALGGGLGDAGRAFLQRLGRDWRECPPGTFRVSPGKGMVLPLVPAGRGRRYRVLGPRSAPGLTPAAVRDEGRSLAG